MLSERTFKVNHTHSGRLQRHTHTLRTFRYKQERLPKQEELIHTEGWAFRGREVELEKKWWMKQWINELMERLTIRSRMSQKYREWAEITKCHCEQISPVWPCETNQNRASAAQRIQQKNSQSFPKSRARFPDPPLHLQTEAAKVD